MKYERTKYIDLDEINWDTLHVSYKDYQHRVDLVIWGPISLVLLF